MSSPRVISTRSLLTTPIWSAEEAELEFADGTVHKREVVRHPGAVGVVAWDRGKVLLIEQYRYAPDARMWELPAGLLDVAGEPASKAAARELAEEASLAAETWRVLVDLHTTPGMSDEAARIFLATDILPAARPAGFTLAAEEADITLKWTPVEQAVDRVMSGAITNPLAVMGILAVAHAERDGFDRLRPADAPWPWRPAHSG